MRPNAKRKARLGHVADVRHQYGVFHGAQRVIGRAAAPAVEYVQAGTGDPIGGQRLDERRLVHDWAAGDVHEEG